jgi:uncharacterized membrane protein
MPSQPRNPAASAPAVPRLGALPTLALILSALGAALSLVTLYIHNRLAADQGDYTSFCDVSAELSCDLVLGSGYASFLGIPVAGWALASYAASALLAFALLRAGAEMLPRIATAFVALTGAMLAISLYFLAISTLVIGVACPMCLSLDAVNVALFATAVAVARIARSATFSPRSPLLVAGALTAAAIVALVVFQGPGDAASGSGARIRASTLGTSPSRSPRCRSVRARARARRRRTWTSPWSSSPTSSVPIAGAPISI